MKQRVLKIIVLLLCSPLFAQDYENFVKYYKDNLSTLNMIEGIYDVNIESWGANPYTRFPSDFTNGIMFIYKEQNDVYRVAFQSDNGEIFAINTTISPIGTTNLYNYKVFWPGSNITDTKRFSLKNGIAFTVSHSIPDAQLRYDARKHGRTYYPGESVNYIRSYIKIYPTPEMYAAEVQIKNTEQENTEWTGTGFALKDGYVVTNYHVVENANQIRIYGVNGNFTTDYKAELIAKDTHNDLAILYITDYRFNGFSTIPYSINTKNADVGEEIFVLGYPLTSTMGDEIKLSTGIISSRTGYQGDVSLYQISAPIQPGNSGGPLLDSKGNIIGIVSSKHIGTENVGYAIKASYLKNIIESSLVKDILPNTNSVSHISFTEKVKKVKNYVFYVKCKR